MTDLRTGAAGGIALKYTTPNDDSNVIGFIGTGAIARNMARAAAAVRPNFTGVAYALDVDGAKSFATEMSAELGVKFSVAASSEELCGQALAVPLGAWIVLVAKGPLASAGRGFPQMRARKQFDFNFAPKDSLGRFFSHRFFSLRMNYIIQF